MVAVPSAFGWNGCKLAFAFGFNVDAILAAGFNTAGCYTAPSDALLDECLRKGLWLIPDLHIYFYDDAHIDLNGAIAFVNRWKHHPAVAAWYFLDEPDLKSSKFNESAQQGWYNALKAADPNHDFLTVFTAHIEKHWNPNAFDHVCFDAYPYHKDTPNWEPRLRNSCNVCRSRSGGIGGMALVQASYDEEEGALNPTGIVDDMLRVFQEYGIGTQRDGYAMYAWGGHGTPPEDPALLAHVKAVNASYSWPHAPPPRVPEVIPLEIEKPAEERLLLSPAPPQEAERRRREILYSVGWRPSEPLIITVPPSPEITLGEVITSPTWWRENWPWLGVGLTGLVLIVILART